MGISDNVAAYILRMLDEEDGTAEIQRNELAGTLGCVPSQINYVITSRFTPEQGYIVESRRGGGGYIRITRRRLTKADMIMHIVNSIGDTLDSGTARIMIKNMDDNNVISSQEAKMISACVSDKALMPLTGSVRNAVRASIFKNVLLVTE